MANMPNIHISPGFQGGLILSDLLSSEGTLAFTLRRAELNKHDVLFQIRDDRFVFTFSIQDSVLVLQRNDIVSVLSTTELPLEVDPVLVIVRWTHDRLKLWCGLDKLYTEAIVPTQPVTPPPSLLTWARQRNLLPTVEYASEELFRERVYACLASIQDKVDTAGAINPFWDVTYDRRRIRSRTPKRETDIHPTIHAFLSDQMLMASIEVIPEYQTAAGNLDFMFMGFVSGLGIVRLCAEFKLAHSPDVFRGLQIQLPAYMRSTGVRYGAYCVLNFAGQWFDSPRGIPSNDLSFQLHLAKKDSVAVMEQIRIFVYDVSKVDSASNRAK